MLTDTRVEVSLILSKDLYTYVNNVTVNHLTLD